MMELWGQKAYDMDKTRVESLALLVAHFRATKQVYKAFHYADLGTYPHRPKPDALFRELDASMRILDVWNEIYFELREKLADLPLISDD